MASSSHSIHQDSSNKFRFKRKRKHSRDKKVNLNEDSSSLRNLSRHKSKRRKTPSLDDDARAYADGSTHLDTEAAFRESLYDALGDDEGAQYWQSVYGQPIHNYSNSHPNPETGELETMTEEEYATYVRRKMWEKSWEGIEAARKEMRKRREQEKQEAQRNSRKRTDYPEDSRTNPLRAAHQDFEREIEASLHRGARRQERRRWKSLWEAYLLAWENLRSWEEKTRVADHDEQILLKDHIAWPIESGKREDVTAENVERFMKEAARSVDQDEDAETLRISLLKAERVKWHPDKIQQRYGALGLDAQTMQSVTAVFQIFDRMWNDVKSRR